MPRYTMTGLDGKVYSVEGPPGLNREYVQSEILRRAPQAGVPPQEKNMLEEVPLVGGTLAGLAGFPLSIASGLAGTLKTGTDFFGAGNRASQVLGDIAEGAEGLKSSGSREDAAINALDRQMSEGKGTWEEIKSAGRQFGRAPIETTASLVGSALPFLATAGLGGLPAAAALGAASGAGMIKGDIYDVVKEETLNAALEAGEPEAQAIAKAEALAEKAQEYGGKNLDQITLGAGIGALASTFGFTRAVAQGIAARSIARVAGQKEATRTVPGVLRSGVSGAVEEAAPEALQAGQERYAQNLALQREGFDVDPMKGVAGQAAFEGLASLIPGAGGKIYETAPDRARVAAVKELESAAADLTAVASNPQATPEEKDAAVLATAKRFEDLGFSEADALELAQQKRRQEEAKAQAGKDAKTTKAAPAAPLDDTIPEPTLRGGEATNAEKTQEAGVAGAGSGPDVDVAGAAGPSVPDTSAPAPTGEAAEGVSQTQPVGVDGTGVPAGQTAAPEAGDVDSLTPIREAKNLVERRKVTRQLITGMMDTVVGDTVVPNKTLNTAVNVISQEVASGKRFDLAERLAQILHANGVAIQPTAPEAVEEAAAEPAPTPEANKSRVYNQASKDLDAGRITRDEFRAKVGLPPDTQAAPTQAAATEESLADTTAPDTQADQDVSGEAGVATPQPEVDALQKFVDENNPGYVVRFDPKLKGNRKWFFSLPGGKILGRSPSASALRKQILKQPKVGPRETVDGVDVVRYPAVKPKPVTTPKDILSRDAVDPEDAAGKLTEAQQEQIDLLIEEIDKARKARDVSDAERAELVRMLEDTQEVTPAGSKRPVTTTGRNKDSDWNAINSTQAKFDALRKAGKTLRGRQDATGKDLFAKDAKLTAEEKALKEEIKANAAEMKKQADLLLKKKRVIYDRVRERMAAMKADRTKKLAALRADFKAGRINEQRFRALMGQILPDKILYRSGKRDVAGILLADMRNVVRAIVSRWNADVDVKMVQSVDDLPSTVRAEMEKDGRLDAYGFLRGNDVYLIADNMDSLEDIAPTLFHEVLGHYGLRRAFREGLDDILNDLYRTNDKVRTATDAWMKDAENAGLYSGDEDPLARAVEEVLANASEDGPLSASKFDRLVRYVREAIRKMFGFDLAVSNRELRTILAMAHEQAIAGDSNAVGSSSNLYASKKAKKAVKAVLTAEDIAQKNIRMMQKTRGDQIDPKEFNAGFMDAIKGGLKSREFKYYLGLMSPKKFADRFIGLGGLRILDTNELIEYAGTLLGPEHEAVKLMNATLNAVNRLNGTRMSVRTRLGKNVSDLRDFIQNDKSGGSDLSMAIDYGNYFNVNMAAIKPNMSDAEVFQTDNVWNFYNDLLKNPKLTKKDRNSYTKKKEKREGDLVGAAKVWRKLSANKGGVEMYTRIRDMHRNMYEARRLMTEKFIEELKEVGASDNAVKRILLDLSQQHDKAHDTVNAPDKGEEHEEYPEVPLGKFHREYFPKRRYGPFWLRVRKTEFGKPVLTFFTTAAERDEALEFWAKELGKPKDNSTFFVYGDQVTKELNDFDRPSTNSALYRVMETIEKTNPDKFDSDAKYRLIGDVYQLSLLASPEGTIRKQFIKSKNRLGWSADTLRVVADTTEEYATDIARLKHRNEIDRELLSLKKLTDPKGEKGGVESADTIKTIRSFLVSMEERVDSEYKAVTDSIASRIVSGANQLAYVSFLTSAATALVQIVAVPMRVSPYLSARYGTVDANKALARYMNVFRATPKLEDKTKGIRKSLRILTLRESTFVKNSPRHKQALDSADREYALITPMSSFTQRRERTPGSSRQLKRERIMENSYDLMTYMLDTTDQLTREAVFMAAYDLEYDKLSAQKDLAPKDRQKLAVERAVKSVADTVGNFNSIYRPPVMKGSELAKAVYLFKYYSVITTAFFFRAGRAMARGIAAIGNPDKKAQREEAAIYTKELIGTLGVAFVLGGAKTMPLYTIGMLALQALQDATDDDEDRRERMKRQPLTADSVEAQFEYEFMPRMFGPATITGADDKQHSFSDILLNGAASELSGWNLGSRVSLDLTGLWFRAPRDADTWVGTFENALVENIPGASASLNVVAMGEKFAKGDVMEALKIGLPAQIKAGVKTFEFATEGVRTGNEKIRMAKEDISNSQLVGTALGMNPTEIAKLQKRGRFVTSRLKELADQKVELLNDAKIAVRRVRNGDAGAEAERDEAFAAIREYNDKVGNPLYEITASQVLASLMASTKDELYDIDGLGLDMKENIYVDMLKNPK